MKRKTAKEILSDSFRELAKQKTIDKIKIKDITENCGYSVATFYRQFKDKYDLIAWDYIRDQAEIMNRIEGKNYEWRQTLYDGAEYFYTHKDYLANLSRHTNGYESFFGNMIEIHNDTLKKYILKSSGLDELDEKTEMYILTYCLGTVSLTCEWILGRYDVSPEVIAEVYEMSLPQPLKQYLY